MDTGKSQSLRLGSKSRTLISKDIGGMDGGRRALQYKSQTIWGVMNIN